MKDEYVEGFLIPFRELTEEESLYKITLNRFDQFHVDVGEDFVDQISSVNTKAVAILFAGFAMAKHPEWSLELLECIDNDPYTQLVQDVYRDFSDQSDELFYSDFAEFLNQTVDLRKAVNQVLVQVSEYYS